MAEVTKPEVGTDETSPVDRLLELVKVPKPTSVVDIEQYSNPEVVSEQSAIVAAAVRVFLDAVVNSTQKVERVDKNLIDFYIAELDKKLSEQLDEILHHEKFQKLESAWRGLKFLVDRTDFRSNIKIEILNVSKDELWEDFEDVPEPVQSGLYEHVYNQEYNQPGGESIAAMIANYEFDASPRDIALLPNISKVAVAAHCPFIASVGLSFFGMDTADEVAFTPDLEPIFEAPEYTKWRSFRDIEDSRCIGLTFPRFLLRLPYNPYTNPVKSFNYLENVKAEDHDKYLWGNASFALAANMTRSFAKYGWCVQICGLYSGGIVDNLPVRIYRVSGDKQVKIPTEIIITDRREFELAELGFIPLCWHRNTDDACFFSANSIQKPTIYSTDSETMTAEEATANSRILSRLPYLFLVSRLAHYLKVIQLENVGATKDKSVLQRELQMWMNTLVTVIPNPSPLIIAHRPLREAHIIVEDIKENPGFFNVHVYVEPHTFRDPPLRLHFQMVL